MNCCAVLITRNLLILQTARYARKAGRKEHPAEADSLDAALIARYRQAREIRQLSDLLAAFGNSVGPAVLPVIEEALHDPRDPVRATAARALRLAEAPEIDSLLSAAITSDGEPRVRAAATFATSFRHSTGTLAAALIRPPNQMPWSTSEATQSRSFARTRKLRRTFPKRSPGFPFALTSVFMRHATQQKNPVERILAARDKLEA